MITIEIPLEPYAQERPRFAKVGRFVKVYDSAKSKAWKTAARLYIRAAILHLKGRPKDGHAEIPVYQSGTVLGVRLRFFFPLPKSAHRKRQPPMARWYTGSMDFDNLAKCVCDAGNGLLWADDRQIAYAEVFKIRVAQGGRQPGVSIEAWELDQATALQWEGL